MIAQDFYPDGMKGAQPIHAFYGVPDDRPYPFLHLKGGLVGEGHGQYLIGIGTVRGQDMGKAGDQNAGLAGPGPGQYQKRTIDGLNRLSLRRIQAVKIGGIRRGKSRVRSDFICRKIIKVKRIRHIVYIAE